MKVRLLVMALFSTALFFAGCDNDDDGGSPFTAPEVTAPAGVATVGNGATGQSVDFIISIDPDVTASYEATGTNVTISNPSGTATSGTLTINFDAGTTAGGASVTVEVTDTEGQSDDATAVINILADEDIVYHTGEISGEETWASDKVHILGSRVSVVDGACLTINPGTIIKGEAGTGANATALLIARGGKIMAEGAADAPIIFTSIADKITPEDVAAGNFESPNLNPDINGLWGGLIVLGKATISASNDNDDDISEVQIEGIPTSDTNGLYGGSEDDDNSGVLKYLSIRHGGSNIGQGNEINGLTLGGVGSETVVENIEVVANQDDGIEWFGGTVSVKNVVIWNAGDDAIDTDQSWAGTLDNFVVVTPAGHCFELDGPEGSFQAGHTIMNGTIITSKDGRISGDIINTDDNSRVALKNLYFTGILDDPLQQINRTTHAEGEVTFEGIMLDIPSGVVADYIADSDTAPAGITAGGSSQADVSGFGWTWSSKGGALEGL